MCIIAMKHLQQSITLDLFYHPSMTEAPSTYDGYALTTDMFEMSAFGVCVKQGDRAKYQIPAGNSLYILEPRRGILHFTL